MSILLGLILEPHQMNFENDDLLKLHEQYTNCDETTTNEPLQYTCIKLSDGELLRDAKLCWTSSYLLPDFVSLEQNNDFNEKKEPIDQNAIDFFKLNKKPSSSLVKKNLANLAKKFSLKYHKIKYVKIINILFDMFILCFFLIFSVTYDYQQQQ